MARAISRRQHSAPLAPSGRAFTHNAAILARRRRLSQNTLINAVTWLTDPEAITVTRTGARKSVFPDTQIPSNTADAFSIGGIPLVAAMGGATNLLSTVVNGYANTAVTFVDLGNGEYQATLPPDSEIRESAATIISTTYNTSFEYMVVSGDVGSTEWRIQRNDGSPFTIYTSSALSNVSSWTSQSLTATTDGVSTSTRLFALRRLAGATGNLVIKIRNVRSIQKTSPYPAFPLGSTAGASYTADSIALNTSGLPSKGSMIICFRAYGWSSTHPVNEFGRVFSFDNDAFRIEGNGFNTGDVDFVAGADRVQITGGPIDFSNTVIMCASWDGTNIYLDLEGSRYTQLSAYVPTNLFTNFIGNRAALDRTSHAAIAIGLISDRVITRDEYNELASDISSRLNDFNFDL